jgi:hypothetical protein
MPHRRRDAPRLRGVSRIARIARRAMRMNLSRR